MTRLGRIPAHIRQLNPELDATTSRTLASGQTDGADTLHAELRRLAPVLAPLFVREYPFDRWSIDLASPSHLLAVEVDGGQWKSGGGKHGRAADYRKIRALTLASWLVLRFTVAEVEADPAACIADIRAGLARERR